MSSATAAIVCHVAHLHDFRRNKCRRRHSFRENASSVTRHQSSSVRVLLPQRGHEQDALFPCHSRKLRALIGRVTTTGRWWRTAHACTESPGQEREGACRPTISEGDHMLRCLSPEAEVSVLAVVATDLVKEAQLRHGLSPTASAALGRALMGTILLGAFKGEGETVQLNLKGDGPLGFMTTVGNANGQVKGLVTNASADPPLKENGKLDVGAAVGQGTLSVVRNHPTWKFPYRGSVLIQTGEIAEDITYYLAESEQTNSAIGLGVTVNRDGTVKSAGGFMVQVLPFVSEETLERVEQNVKSMPTISGVNAVSVIETLLQGIGIGDWSEQITPKYGPCEIEELKSRMKFAVKTLGQDDIKKAIDEEGGLEVKCEFCADLVRFDESDLGSLLEEMKRDEEERVQYAG